MDTASVDFSDRIRNTRRKGKIEKNTPDKYLTLAYIRRARSRILAYTLTGKESNTSDGQGKECYHTSDGQENYN